MATRVLETLILLLSDENARQHDRNCDRLNWRKGFIQKGKARVATMRLISPKYQKTEALSL